MNVIVGFECSGAVRDEFAKRGHNAWSCDLKPSEKPGNHLIGDIKLHVGLCEANYYKGWDLGIFHPPCTYLCVTGNKWFKDQPPRKSGALVGEARRIARKEAIDLFLWCARLPIPKKALENPIGCMSTHYREPDQIIQPYFFGDSAPKTTCLWLYGLPKLFHAKERDLFNDKITHVEPGEYYTFASGKKISKWFSDTGGKGEERQASRSRTFPGIAQAMAEQWR